MAEAFTFRTWPTYHISIDKKKGTKGMTALALAHLVGERKVAYADKVSKYWPEFACEGKSDWCVRACSRTI